MSRRSDEDIVIVPDMDRADGSTLHDEADTAPPELIEAPRLRDRLGLARLREPTRRAGEAIVRALPLVARMLIAIGVVALLFVAFVVVFGAMRHTTRQEHLEEAFRTRVSRGHADGPNWRPVPGQAIATVTIPAIGLYEVVVHDTTTQLLETGPGHLLGTPLPGHAGNAVILGRRITQGAPFRNLADLSPGDPITVVTPAGVFRYQVVGVSRVAPDESVLAATPEARLTLITSGSPLVPSDRLVVTASLDGTPIVGAPVPQVALTTEQLGGTGDSGAIVPLIGWLVLAIVALILWIPLRRRFASRMTRILVPTPVLGVLLFFVFVNAEDLLPGVI